MKKAKIMLAAIAVIAVAGGSLALKAQKFGVNSNLSTTCDLPSVKKCDDAAGTAISYTNSGTGTTHNFAGYVVTGTACTSDANCTVGVTLTNVD